MKTKIWIFLPLILIFSSCNKTENNKKEVAISAKPTAKSTDSAEEDHEWEDVKGIYESSYEKFSGAWFDVEYPANFTAKGSEKSATSDGFDSATFTSPDGKVQFYVYSPQWNGEPKDIAVKNSEEQVDFSQQTNFETVVKRWVIEAKDGSYQRYYEETLVGATNKIFGIKYASKADYDRYKDQYLQFKKSLMQYAD